MLKSTAGKRHRRSWKGWVAQPCQQSAHVRVRACAMRVRVHVRARVCVPPHRSWALACACTGLPMDRDLGTRNTLLACPAAAGSLDPAGCARSQSERTGR